MKSGIAPVVAVVLLIAIAVIASVAFWYWVLPLTTKPPLAETTFKGFAVVTLYKNSTGNGCIGLDIKNVGGNTISNAIFYIKDYTTGKAVGVNGTDPTYPAYVNITAINRGDTVHFNLSGSAQVAGSFTEQNVTGTNTSCQMMSLAVGDGNNDGQNELYGGYTFCSGNVKQYKNESGAWTETVIGALSATPGIAVGDADNDGLKEVVGVAGANGGVKMFKNTSGTWQTTDIASVGDSYSGNSIAIGDADNDGQKEVVVEFSANGNDLRLYKNVSGGWQESNISYTAYYNGVAIGDANNDGKNEIVVGLLSSARSLRMYANNTANARTQSGWTETNISSLSMDLSQIAVGDADNDEQNEITAPLYTTTGNNTRMYKNTTGTWVETNISAIPANVIATAIGDADNDGNNEIVVLVENTSATASFIRLYSKEGSNWVETNITLPTKGGSGQAQMLAIGDANNDGYNDISAILSGDTSNPEMRVYETTPVASSGSIPLGTYILRTSSPGFADQIFTCA